MQRRSRRPNDHERLVPVEQAPQGGGLAEQRGSCRCRGAWRRRAGRRCVSAVWMKAGRRGDPHEGQREGIGQVGEAEAVKVALPPPACGAEGGPPSGSCRCRARRRKRCGGASPSPSRWSCRRGGVGQGVARGEVGCARRRGEEGRCATPSLPPLLHVNGPWPALKYTPCIGTRKPALAASAASATCPSSCRPRPARPGRGCPPTLHKLRCPPRLQLGTGQLTIS